MKILEQSSLFDTEVLEKSKEQVVIVDFWASWCGPCLSLAPILEKVAKDNPNITVIKVDVDNHNDLAIKYHIRSVPTMLFFRNSEIKNTVIGVKTQKDIEELINSIQ